MDCRFSGNAADPAMPEADGGDPLRSEAWHRSCADVGLVFLWLFRRSAQGLGCFEFCIMPARQVGAAEAEGEGSRIAIAVIPRLRAREPDTVC